MPVGNLSSPKIDSPLFQHYKHESPQHQESNTRNNFLFLILWKEFSILWNEFY